jgi:hypothetical protein
MIPHHVSLSLFVKKSEFNSIMPTLFYIYSNQINLPGFMVVSGSGEDGS